MSGRWTMSVKCTIERWEARSKELMRLDDWLGLLESGCQSGLQNAQRRVGGCVIRASASASERVIVLGFAFGLWQWDVRQGFGRERKCIVLP
jgi:hypothetical protein